VRLDDGKSAPFRASARPTGRFDRLRRMRCKIYRRPERPTARSCQTTTRNRGNVGYHGERRLLHRITIQGSPPH
jgi:hypothetical protein